MSEERNKSYALVVEDGQVANRREDICKYRKEDIND